MEGGTASACHISRTSSVWDACGWVVAILHLLQTLTRVLPFAPSHGVVAGLPDIRGPSFSSPPTAHQHTQQPPTADLLQEAQQDANGHLSPRKWLGFDLRSGTGKDLYPIFVSPRLDHLCDRMGRDKIGPKALASPRELRDSGWPSRVTVVPVGIVGTSCSTGQSQRDHGQVQKLRDVVRI